MVQRWLLKGSRDVIGGKRSLAQKFWKFLILLFIIFILPTVRFFHRVFELTRLCTGYFTYFSNNLFLCLCGTGSVRMMDLTLLFVGVWFTKFTKRNVRLPLCLLLFSPRHPLFLANFSLSLSLSLSIVVSALTFVWQLTGPQTVSFRHLRTQCFPWGASPRFSTCSRRGALNLGLCRILDRRNI